MSMTQGELPMPEHGERTKKGVRGSGGGVPLYYLVPLFGLTVLPTLKKKTKEISK